MTEVDKWSGGPYTAGSAHPKWRGGLGLNSDGYWRITAGPKRFQMVHRAWFEVKLGRKLRLDEEVHHQNLIRHCLCEGNLILMDAALHHGIQRDNNYNHRRKNRKLKETQCVVEVPESARMRAFEVLREVVVETGVGHG